MYTALLIVDSHLRWLILIAALLVVVRALAGVITKRPWGRGDDVAAKVFVHSLSLQLVIGLVLYFVSPFTGPAFADFGGTMRDAGLRFMMVEHQVGMFIAVALAHIGLGRVD